MESGAGGNRRKRRKAATRAHPLLAIRSGLASGERSGAQEAGQGESAARKVPSAVSNQVGVRVRGKGTHSWSCQAPPCLPWRLRSSSWFTCTNPSLRATPCWAQVKGRSPGSSCSLPGLETGTCLKQCYGVGSFLKLVVDQGKSCEHELGNPELHHAQRTTNRVKCQRLSCGLVLFARFGLFLSLPPPPPFEFA